MKERNHFIDLAKGIAIIMVVITHYSWTDAERSRYLFYYWVSMAVPIFMIVTGFNFSAFFLKRELFTLKDVYQPVVIKKRIISYTIPFLLMYLLELVLEFAKGNTYSLGKLLKNFIVGGIGKYGTYYYPVLIQLVFIVPLLYYLVKKWHYGIVVCFLLNLAYEIGKHAIDLSRADYRLLAFRYMFAIAVGCYLCVYPQKRTKWKWIVMFFIGAFYIWLISYTDYKPVLFNRWYTTSMMTVFYIAPIYILGQNLLKNMRCRWIEELGKASYHIFLVQIIYYNYVSPHLNLEIRMLKMLLGVVLSLGFGYGYYLLYNKVRARLKKRS